MLQLLRIEAKKFKCQMTVNLFMTYYYINIIFNAFIYYQQAGTLTKYPCLNTNNYSEQ